MSYHDCRNSLCVTPHYENDDHEEECLCDLCHEHIWQEWNVYPECDGCLAMLSEWLHENTDLIGCQYRELCDYGAGCPLWDERMERQRHYKKLREMAEEIKHEQSA